VTRRRRNSRDPGILDELEEIGSRLAQLGERSVAAGQEAAAREIDELRVGLAALAERAQTRGDDALESVVDAVRRQPLGSVATAFAIGLGLAFMLGRR
jgi:ElaB/YqjD/DUF883 family membrane-anchored ribosome-binding protein